MPQYEYVSVEDGETITLIRPMAESDSPVDDPKGLGRTFVRQHSTFAVGGTQPSVPLKQAGGCGCGNPHGPCHN